MDLKRASAHNIWIQHIQSRALVCPKTADNIPESLPFNQRERRPENSEFNNNKWAERRWIPLGPRSFRQFPEEPDSKQKIHSRT